MDTRNPWGKARKGVWEGAWSDGSKEWTTDVQQELGHNFGGDSVFWISYEDLLRKYQHFDRTRLFRDPDWRCSQHWLGVDVPWKPQFNEKLQIKLTRESPLVLVLSQLDNRYFKGLRGQYLFRLHFRLHERDSPGAEDYIVRSHGNYLMNRSVSIELPCMLPGTYSVFISVVGERDTSLSSVEEVVKRECKGRVENEKLAEVGRAYDLAHSKATAHLEAVAALRKKADQKRASAARTKERHRQWEKRHITRDINKKQGRKNNKKLDARNAEKDEQAKKAAEEALRIEAAKKAAEEAAKIEAEKKAAEEAVRIEAEEAKKKQEEQATKPQDKAVQTEGEKQQATESAQGEEAKDSKSEAKGDDESKPEDKKAEDSNPSDEKGESKAADSSSKGEDGKSVDDDCETPETTPVPTPTVTPAEEKTEEEVNGEKKAEVSKEDATGEKSKVDEKSSEKADDKTPADPASAGSSNSSGSPRDTPKSEDSVPASDGKGEEKEKVSVPPVDASNVSGAPPPAAAATSTAPTTSAKATKPKVYVTSDGESSASPIEDWEDLYSSDDMTRKPRPPPPPPPPGTVMQSKYADESEDENAPEAWNAICVVGFRVYSKDEDLELKVVMEGGELEEGGMGEKGEVDLDNAQSNAAGQRGVPKEAVVEDKKDDGGYEGDSEVEEKQKEGKE